MAPNIKSSLVWLVGLLLVFSGLVGGFSISRWVFPRESKYGSIEELETRYEEELKTIQTQKDSIALLKQQSKVVTQKIKQDKSISDEKHKDLSSRDLSDKQLDSLLQSIKNRN